MENWAFSLVLSDFGSMSIAEAGTPAATSICRFLAKSPRPLTMILGAAFEWKSSAARAGRSWEPPPKNDQGVRFHLAAIHTHDLLREGEGQGGADSEESGQGEERAFQGRFWEELHSESGRPKTDDRRQVRQDSRHKTDDASGKTEGNENILKG